jgi:hypothetical protein
MPSRGFLFEPDLNARRRTGGRRKNSPRSETVRAPGGNRPHPPLPGAASTSLSLVPQLPRQNKSSTGADVMSVVGAVAATL